MSEVPGDAGASNGIGMDSCLLWYNTKRGKEDEDWKA